jgi:hypothetical protein
MWLPPSVPKAEKATGLRPEAFAVLWYLRGKGIKEDEAESIAHAAAAAFEHFRNGVYGRSRSERSG